jgi:hypothetical protein
MVVTHTADTVEVGEGADGAVFKCSATLPLAATVVPKADICSSTSAALLMFLLGECGGFTASC